MTNAVTDNFTFGEAPSSISHAESFKTTEPLLILTLHQDKPTIFSGDVYRGSLELSAFLGTSRSQEADREDSFCEKKKEQPQAVVLDSILIQLYGLAHSPAILHYSEPVQNHEGDDILKDFQRSLGDTQLEVGFELMVPPFLPPTFQGESTRYSYNLCLVVNKRIMDKSKPFGSFVTHPVRFRLPVHLMGPKNIELPLLPTLSPTILPLMPLEKTRLPCNDVNSLADEEISKSENRWQVLPKALENWLDERNEKEKRYLPNILFDFQPRSWKGGSYTQQTSMLSDVSPSTVFTATEKQSHLTLHQRFLEIWESTLGIRQFGPPFIESRMRSSIAPYKLSKVKAQVDDTTESNQSETNDEILLKIFESDSSSADGSVADALDEVESGGMPPNLSYDMIGDALTSPHAFEGPAQRGKPARNATTLSETSFIASPNYLVPPRIAYPANRTESIEFTSPPSNRSPSSLSESLFPLEGGERDVEAFSNHGDSFDISSRKFLLGASSDSGDAVPPSSARQDDTGESISVESSHDKYFSEYPDSLVTPTKSISEKDLLQSSAIQQQQDSKNKTVAGSNYRRSNRKSSYRERDDECATFDLDDEVVFLLKREKYRIFLKEKKLAVIEIVGRYSVLLESFCVAAGSFLHTSLDFSEAAVHLCEVHVFLLRIEKPFLAKRPVDSITSNVDTTNGLSESDYKNRTKVMWKHRECVLQQKNASIVIHIPTNICRSFQTDIVDVSYELLFRFYCIENEAVANTPQALNFEAQTIVELPWQKQLFVLIPPPSLTATPFFDGLSENTIQLYETSDLNEDNAIPLLSETAIQKHSLFAPLRSVLDSHCYNAYSIIGNMAFIGEARTRMERTAFI
ncbi:hypothetical protein IE077_002945 [Cardiosporidium cionae]|uniref:Uncharacterized protein n=1 Tax=Cardiosporidium cionae TaxID=476202 RepID=A0ABQ7JFI4_9APIC|nr:hypothetical protein IE077_002945 [Cardiosporidium cionae]|eukprot:KAF8822709.1 hypothetical protein IE077_002945 [Cardiosporidium cionae]